MIVLAKRVLLRRASPLLLNYFGFSPRLLHYPQGAVVRAHHHHLHPWLLSLATSDVHPANLGQQLENFVPRVKEAGISRIAFLRHGKTAPKPAGGHDWDRQLTEEGRQQARNAGSSYLTQQLLPIYPILLVSPSPRTIETAQLIVESAVAAVAAAKNAEDKKCLEEIQLKPVQVLYDGTMQPAGSKLFSKLGYAPLKDYLNAQDAHDRDVARECLGDYAQDVASTILNICQENSSNVNKIKNEKKRMTLCVVAHAIYLPAAALGVATLANCDEPSQEMILSSMTQEAEGYLIDLEERRATYLSRF